MLRVQELSVPAVEIVGPNGAPQSSDSDATEKDFEVQSWEAQKL